MPPSEKEVGGIRLQRADYYGLDKITEASQRKEQSVRSLASYSLRNGKTKKIGLEASSPEQSENPYTNNNS